ncbi:MAG: hypothetical protein WDN27_02625 [Candidatus Saccharibacteria bacterium]
MDTAYCGLKKIDMTYDADFDPQQSVTKALYEEVPDAHELSVIIPPWHANEWLLKRIAGQQRKLGRSTLMYLFDDNILSSDAERTLTSFVVIAGRIETDLHDKKAEAVHWFATSLGTSVLMHTLGSKKLLATTIDFVVPGGDLAKSLWTGLRTRPLREQFEAQGITLSQLQKLWIPLAPTVQAAKIHDTDITMSISLADQIIRPDTAFEFANALRESGNRVTIHTNSHLGHYGTILASGFSG